jgi:hypothetical protein
MDVDVAYDNMADMLLMLTGDHREQKAIFTKRMGDILTNLSVLSDLFLPHEISAGAAHDYANLWATALPKLCAQGTVPKRAYSREGAEMLEGVLALRAAQVRLLKAEPSQSKRCALLVKELERSAAAVNLADKGLSNGAITSASEASVAHPSVSQKHLAIQFADFCNTQRWVDFQTRVEDRIAVGDTSGVINAFIQEPHRNAVSWRFMLGHPGYNVHLHPVLQQCVAYRDRFLEYHGTRIAAVYQGKKSLDSMIGFKLEESDALSQVVKKRAVTQLDIHEQVMNKINTFRKKDLEDFSSQKPIWTNLISLILFGEYAPAVLGGLGVTTQVVGDPSTLESIQGTVNILAGFLREAVTMNDEDYTEAIHSALVEFGAEIMEELEERINRTYWSTVVDMRVDLCFVDKDTSSAWKKLTNIMTHIESHDGVHTALPYMRRMQERQKLLTQELQQLRGKQDVVTSAGGEGSKKRDRSGSSSPVARQIPPTPSFQVSQGDYNRLMNRLNQLEASNKAVQFANDLLTAEDPRPSPRRGRVAHAAIASEKHPDSGKIQQIRGQIVLTQRNGDMVGMPVSEVKRLLPPDAQGKCLQVAVSNQTGDQRMKHCPCKDRAGHANMQDVAHKGIPRTVARQFIEGTKPFRMA